jgi:hypothetical protein
VRERSGETIRTLETDSTDVLNRLAEGGSEHRRHVASRFGFEEGEGEEGESSCRRRGGQ